MATATATRTVRNTTATANAGRDAYQAAMRTMFELVENKADWRAPIDAMVDASCDTVNLIMAAVEFFTATKAKADFVRQTETAYLWHVTADGYRKGPAGDH